MIELKPCPFCGASAKGAYYNGKAIEIPLEEMAGSEKAVRNWNRRATNENDPR